MLLPVALRMQILAWADSAHLASPRGETIQRIIVAYFTEAIVDRTLKGWPGLHKDLNLTKISSISKEILVQKLFFELCPFLKLLYGITNQAIIEAMEGEKMVHITDFNSFESIQWINLLQLYSARAKGPPAWELQVFMNRKTCCTESQPWNWQFFDFAFPPKSFAQNLI